MARDSLRTPMRGSSGPIAASPQTGKRVLSVSSSWQPGRGQSFTNATMPKSTLKEQPLKVRK